MTKKKVSKPGERPGQRLSRVRWMLKQLLPLTYWSKYTENGRKYLAIWKMWGGKTYDAIKVEVK